MIPKAPLRSHVHFFFRTHLSAEFCHGHARFNPALPCSADIHTYHAFASPIFICVSSCCFSHLPADLTSRCLLPFASYLVQRRFLLFAFNFQWHPPPFSFPSLFFFLLLNTKKLPNLFKKAPLPPLRPLVVAMTLPAQCFNERIFYQCFNERIFINNFFEFKFIYPDR